MRLVDVVRNIVTEGFEGKLEHYLHKQGLYRGTHWDIDYSGSTTMLVFKRSSERNKGFVAIMNSGEFNPERRGSTQIAMKKMSWAEARTPKFDGKTTIKGRGSDGSMQNLYDLGMGYMGNGLTIWNRAIVGGGDYKKVAHIQHPEMTITWNDKNLPPEVKKKIKDIAAAEKRAWEKGQHYYQSRGVYEEIDEAYGNRLDVGDYLKQITSEESDMITYGKIVSKQKNGGFRAAVIMVSGGSVRGNAKFSSTKGWYPNPVKIDKSEIPPKALSKIEKKLDESLNEAIPPSQEFGLSVGGKLIAKGSKKKMFALAKKHGGLQRGKVFVMRTKAPVGTQTTVGKNESVDEARVFQDYPYGEDDTIGEFVRESKLEVGNAISKIESAKAYMVGSTYVSDDVMKDLKGITAKLVNVQKEMNKTFKKYKGFR